MLEATTLFCHNETILKQKNDKDPILLNMENSKYYALDELGNRIYELCDSKNTLRDILQTIVQEYDAPAEIIEKDVQDFLQNLVKENILYVKQ